MAGMCIPGRLAKLRVSDDAGLTFENYGGIVDISMQINVDELECTSHDDNGSRVYIPNHDDATMDVSGRWLDGDPGQEIALVNVFAKTVYPFEFLMESAPGRKLFTGNTFSTSTNPSGPLDDTGSLDLSFRVSGLGLQRQ